MKIVGICGHFGYGKTLLNGQTIKTQTIAETLQQTLGNESVLTMDTSGGREKVFGIISKIPRFVKQCRSVIILPAENGLRVLAPFFSIICSMYQTKLFYSVIGGWLPDYLQQHNWLKKYLKRFNGIWVETVTMQKALQAMGMSNVVVVPNFKQLQALTEEDIVYPQGEPLKLCTFSRVMEEKGIEEAILAVREINDKYKRTVYSLDIYGQIDVRYEQKFTQMRCQFPEYIRYSGMVPGNESVGVLKEYFALLFPTFYEGEGFAGTLIDAFSAGVPVIASDWKANSEFIDNFKTGWVYPSGEIKTLYDSLLWALKHKSEMYSMRPLASQKALKFSPQYWTDKIVEMIE